MKHDESFYVKNFLATQLTYTSRANSTLLTCLIYKELAAAIRSHDMTQLKTIVDIKLNLYGISLRDLPFQSHHRQHHQHQQPNDLILVGGEKYTPPLEVAASVRNFLAFSYLLESIFAALTSSVNTEKNLVQRQQASARANEFNEYLSELREAAEESEIYELVDILDNFEEDKEIAAITDDGPSADFNRVYWESLNMESGENSTTTNNKKTTTMTTAKGASLRVVPNNNESGGGASFGRSLIGGVNIKKKNLQQQSTQQKQDQTLNVVNQQQKSQRKSSSDSDYNSKLNSKFCAIL